MVVKVLSAIATITNFFDDVLRIIYNICTYVENRNTIFLNLPLIANVFFPVADVFFAVAVVFFSRFVSTPSLNNENKYKGLYNS